LKYPFHAVLCHWHSYSPLPETGYNRSNGDGHCGIIL
jgi:hypothetical protein